MADQTDELLWDAAAPLPAEPYLSVTSPPDVAGMTVRLQPGRRVLIGREGKVIAAAAGMSRRHAWLEYDGRALFVQDAGSTNGTVVNQTVITTRTRLLAGDEVRLGEFTATVHEPLSTTSPDRSGEPRSAEESGNSTEVTRHLCAAVYADPYFRDYVLDEIVEQPYRFVAPSFGVDLVALAAHAIAARDRRLVRDLALTVTLVVLVIGVAVLVTASSDAAWAVVSLALVVAWILVTVETSWIRRLVGRRLALEGASDDGLPRPTSARLRARLEDLGAVQAGNVTVFTDYVPFVGFGEPFDHWSFAYDIEKGVADPGTGQRRRPHPFTAGDLYESLAHELAGCGLPGVKVTERLFVHGRDVGLLPGLLPDRLRPPRGHASPRLLRQVLDKNPASARTYLSVQVTGWHGQLVTTLLLRVVTLNGSLYVEATSLALLPLSQEVFYRDWIPHRATDLTVDALWAGVRHTLPALLAAPFRARRALAAELVSRRRRRDQRCRVETGTFDYGATTSVRERAASPEFYRYFLEYDRDMYDKVVQERLLRHVELFLERHGVDMGSFQMTVNNNTITNSNNVNTGVNTGNVGGKKNKARNGVESPAAT